MEPQEGSAGFESQRHIHDQVGGARSGHDLVQPDHVGVIRHTQNLPRWRSVELRAKKDSSAAEVAGVVQASVAKAAAVLGSSRTQHLHLDA